MKIALLTHSFWPSIGGIESNSITLAQQFSVAGHEVRIATQTPGADCFEGLVVLRGSKAGNLLRLATWCDIWFQNNISLQTIMPGFFARKPVVVAHHTWLAQSEGKTGWHERLKGLACRATTNVAMSDCLAERIPARSVRIPNPYDDKIFGLKPGVSTDRDIVLMGRLVPDKGADQLLRVLVRLKAEGHSPTTTIIGDGPEREALEAFVLENGLADLVEFTGSLKGEELAREVCRHRIAVVPSSWREPFGIVALETMACGCLPIVSGDSGLVEAVGNYGVVFKRNDEDDLHLKLLTALKTEGELLPKGHEEHLKNHTGAAVAKKYEALFESLLDQRSRK